MSVRRLVEGRSVYQGPVGQMLVGRSVSWSVGWSVSWSVGRLVSWSVSRSVGQGPVSWSRVGWSNDGRLVGWSVGQLVGRSVGRSVGQSVGQMVGQLVGQSPFYFFLINLISLGHFKSFYGILGQSKSF